MKKLSLRTLIQNLYSLWVYDYHKEYNQLKGELYILVKDLRWQTIQIAALQAKDTSSDCAEFEYTRSLSKPTNFPYPQIKRLENVEVLYDKGRGLPYVMHKGHRLYYPHEYALEYCKKVYCFLIEQDQILEGGYLEKAPHCYQTDTFKVESGDVLIDGGAAEGLFTLENIEKVSRAILIEADKKWIPALNATFAPWQEKVTIINKFLSNRDDRHNVNLASLLAKHPEACFVKMDIEGAETRVLEGCKEYLKTRNDIRLTCCTYHYQGDAENLSKLFDEIRYDHAFSDGWMFFVDYDMPEVPYLRHALIRAQKKKY